MSHAQISKDFAIKKIESLLQQYEKHTPTFFEIEDAIERYCDESLYCEALDYTLKRGIKATLLGIYTNLEANKTNLEVIKRRLESADELIKVLSSPSVG